MEETIKRMKIAVVSVTRWMLEAADDVWWDYQFRRSPQVLEMLAREAHEEFLAGLTEDFDPYNDPDRP